MTRILLSSNPTNLAAALAAFTSTVTVEAEFGETVVEGSLLTLAHHGARSANQAPCLADNGVAGDPAVIEAIGVSHIDLDAIGGVLAVQGYKPDGAGFWALAAFVDVNGAHKLAQAEASDLDVARLYGFWAWAQTHRVFPPRDGSVADVTDEVTKADATIRNILAGDQDLLEAGAQFKLDGEALNKRSFVELMGGVIVRVADMFINHLYLSPDDEVAMACVGFNTLTGGVTVSLADPIPGISARAIVQSIWGGEAGGQDGIAGSPRGKRLGLTDLAKAAEAVRDMIASTSVECDYCGVQVHGLLPGQLPEGWTITDGCRDSCGCQSGPACPACLPRAKEDAGHSRCHHDV